MKKEQEVAKIKPEKNTSDLWAEVLTVIKNTHNTLYGVARLAHVTLEDNTLKLSFAFPFHQKKINDNHNKQLLRDIASKVADKSITVECIVDTSLKDKAADIPITRSMKSDNPSISAISNIFGDSELLES